MKASGLLSAQGISFPLGEEREQFLKLFSVYIISCPAHVPEQFGGPAATLSHAPCHHVSPIALPEPAQLSQCVHCPHAQQRP